MQVQSAPPQSGKIALLSGAIFGIALGLIHIVITIVLQLNNQQQQQNGTPGNLPSTSVILYLVTPLIWIIGFLIGGAWAAKRTGKVGTGTLAGLFAGTFGGVLAGFGQVISAALQMNQQASQYGNLGATSSAGTSLILVGSFATIVYVLILALGAGAGFGALGGLIGQSISGVRPQPQLPVQPVYPPAVLPYGYIPPQQVTQPPQMPQQPTGENINLPQ